MRAIKFRGWTGTKMTTEFLVRGEDGRVLMSPYIGLTGELYEMDDMPLMQFTGLKPKGVDVYEADFVNAYAHAAKGVVEFRHGGFGIAAQDGAGDFIPFSEIHYLDDIEVIGNIYSNPELLS